MKDTILLILGISIGYFATIGLLNYLESMWSWKLPALIASCLLVIAVAIIIIL